MARTRKPRADGTTFALEAAAELAREMPLPPLPLSTRAQRHWPRVIRAKMLNLWNETDLDTAWGLCEDLAKLEELRLVLQTQPSLFKDDKGRIRQHPALKTIEDLERRIQATKRHLQINSSATNGRSDHLRDKNQAHRDLAEIASREDSLFSRPGRK